MARLAHVLRGQATVKGVTVAYKTGAAGADAEIYGLQKEVFAKDERWMPIAKSSGIKICASKRKIDIQTSKVACFGIVLQLLLIICFLCELMVPFVK